jgi:hypothetical protein
VGTTRWSRSKTKRVEVKHSQACTYLLGKVALMCDGLCATSLVCRHVSDRPLWHRSPPSCRPRLRRRPAALSHRHPPLGQPPPEPF